MDSNRTMNGKDVVRESHLSSICRNGNVELVKQFINLPDSEEIKQANYMYRDNHKFTALHHAIFSKKHELIKLLLDVNAIDVKAENVEGETALFLACKTIRLDACVIQWLVDCDKTLVEYVNNEHVSPLQAAIITGRLDYVKILVEAGSPLNYQDWDGETAIIYAIRYATLDIFKYLLYETGCDPTTRNFKHHTPLQLAVMKMTQQNEVVTTDLLELLRDSIVMEQIKDLIKFTIHLNDYNNAEQTNDVLICMATVYSAKIDKYIIFLLDNLYVKWKNSLHIDGDNLLKVFLKFIDKLEHKVPKEPQKNVCSLYFMLMLLELTKAHKIKRAVNYDAIMVFIDILNRPGGVQITIAHLAHFFSLMMKSIDEKDLFYKVCHKIYTNSDINDDNDRNIFSLSGIHSSGFCASGTFFHDIFKEIEYTNQKLHKEQFFNFVNALTHYGIDIDEIFFDNLSWEIYKLKHMTHKDLYNYIHLYLPLIRDQPFKPETVSKIECRTPFEFYEKKCVPHLNKEGVWPLKHLCARLIRKIIFYEKKLTFQERRLLASKLRLPNACTDLLFMNINNFKIYDNRYL